MVSHNLEIEPHAHPASPQAKSSSWISSLKLFGDANSHNSTLAGYERLNSINDQDEVPKIVVIHEEEGLDKNYPENDDDSGVSSDITAPTAVELARPLNGIRRKRSICSTGQPEIYGHFYGKNNNTYGTMGMGNGGGGGGIIPNLGVTNTSTPRQRKISRAVTKRGVTNLTPANIIEGNWPYMADIFTTLLDMDWHNIIITFCFTYFASWLLFAVTWYLIAYFHGDLDPINRNNTEWQPCITELKSFTSAFLFSVETQHTTGYGYFHLTERCPAAVITLCAQSIFGCILEGIMVGLLFVKISRAKKRSLTLLFSRHAVISQRDGQLCFMFRIADMRKSHLLNARVRASVISKRTTAEGEEITISQEELDVAGDGEKSNDLFLFWPTTIIHQITSSSPLYRISAADLSQDNTNFEIVVVLEGIVEATGLTTQAKSSYMPHEILWGHRFKNVTSMKSKTGERIVDYSLFHETYYNPTSPLSAQQLDSLSFTPAVTQQEITKLATSIVKNSIQDSFKQLRSYK